MYRLIFISSLLLSCSTSPKEIKVNFSKKESKKLILEQEKHFKQLKQLSFEGENAEAYFNFSFDKLIYQAHGKNEEFDAIYAMNLNGKNIEKLSSGKGTTTCSYFMPDGKSFIYASTHAGSRELKKPDRSLGYMWALYPDFDIFLAEYPSGNIIKKLTTSDRYDAEATISPMGDKIVFTSLRDGDMEIYTMDLDGSNQKRLTYLPGFDGGPFFSWDGKKIIFRGAHPKSEEKLKKQQSFQDQDLMTPVNLQLYIMDADGSNIKQLTDNNAANFGPFFHPDNQRIIFSSNYQSKSGHGFDLWMIDVNGENLEQITFDGSFNGFPMFSEDGKLLVFGSNRHNKAGSRDTNLFIAEWVD